MNVGEVTHTDLVREGLLSKDYLKSAMELEAFRKYLDHQLAGIVPVRWREEEVTTFMGATTGALERGMLRALTATAGMSLTDDLRLITGRELSPA